MRKFALISAAVMMSLGSIGSAAATVAPATATAVSTSGIASNQLAIGLAQPADDMTSESGRHFGSTGVVIAVVAVILIGLGIYAGTSHHRTRPTSS